MTQQIINVGEVANDGTGESLRTAFEAVNNNFSQVWAAGPVNTNVVIANNVISTVPVNTPLVLAPGGIGNVQSNAHVVPGVSGVYDLGAPDKRWDSAFVDYYYGNGFFLTGIQVANVGSLVNGNSNVVINGVDGVVTISVDSVANVATFTPDGVSILGNIIASSNVTANYFIGDGSLLTGIVASGGSSIDNGNSNVRIGAPAANVAVSVSGVGNVAVFTPTGLEIANTISATTVVSGNIVASSYQGNGAGLSNITGANVTGNVPSATYAIAAAQAGLAGLANKVIDNAQPNITSVGILNSLSVSGNIIGNYIYGNGRFLTGIEGGGGGGGTVTFANIAPPQPNVGDIWIQANTATQFIWFNDTTSNQWAEMEAYQSFGAPVGTDYGDSNVVSLMSAFGSNTVSTTGNITAGYFIGNGSQLTGLPASYSNADAAAYGEAGWAGNIVPAANAVYSLGNIDNQWLDLWVSNSTIYIGNVPLSIGAGNVLTVNGEALLSNDSDTSIATTGNITAAEFFGNIAVANVVGLGNIATVSLDGNASNILHGDGTWGPDANSSYGDSNVVSLLSSFGSNTISTTGNVTANVFIGDGSQLVGVVASSVDWANVAGAPTNVSAFTNDAGYITLSNLSVDTAAPSGNGSLSYNSANGVFTFTPADVSQYGDANVTSLLSAFGSNTISSTGNITTTGNVSGNYVLGNAAFMTGIPASYGNANVVANLAALGTNPVSTTGNVTAGNLITGGLVSAAGNVTGANVFATNITLSGTGTSVNAGQGNILTNQVTGTQFNFLNGLYTVNLNAGQATANYALRLPANAGSNGQLLTTDGTGNLSWTTPASSYGDSNVVTLLSSFGSNTVSTTGNITAGNVNITNLANAANLNLNSGYVNTAASAALNLVPGGSGGTRVWSKLVPNANVAFSLGSTTEYWANGYIGNTISTTVSATGNVTGGNILTAGIVSATGNLTAGNIATGIISASGNVTAQNFVGNISITGNVTGTSSNVTLVAGSYNTTFDNTGNVTLANSNVFVGVTNSILPNTVASFSSNVNSYTQVTNQNKNNGADATADYILTADNGSDTTNYGDFGIINSGYDNNTPTNSLGNIVFAGDTYVYAQGNVSNTSQSGGNLVLGAAVAAKTVKIFAGGNTNSALVANISNVGVSVTGVITVSGNLTAGGIGSATVNQLLSSIQQSPSANNFISNAHTVINGAGGNYLGLGQYPIGATLNGSSVQYGQWIQSGYSNAASPAYYPIILNPAGGNVVAGGNIVAQGGGVVNKATGFVNAGTFVTLDNIKATVTTSGNRSLALATVSGSFSAYVSGIYTLFSGGVAGTGATATVNTTTGNTPIIAWNFTGQGDTVTYIINDTTNSRGYRITMMIGGSYNNNFIAIERL